MMVNPKQPSSPKEIRAFLSCPNDIVEDGYLDLIEDLIRQKNTLLKSFDIKLALTHWKKNISLGRGEPRVQDRINNRLVRYCDIFIGILWTRFGTPPGATLEGICYGSGTEEEFNLARDLDKEIWIFISDCPAQPSQLNVEQLTKVRNFKESLQSKQIQYAEFSSKGEFCKHFDAQICGWLKHRYPIVGETVPEANKDLPSKEDFRKFTKGF